MDHYDNFQAILKCCIKLKDLSWLTKVYQSLDTLADFGHIKK